LLALLLTCLTYFYLLQIKIFIIRYKGPHRKKLTGPILDKMHARFQAEQRNFFKTKSGYGRAITGDGATIMGTKFINFLCQEYGRGTMLCQIKDCTDRLAEVGSVEATFIAHELINTIR